MIHCRRSDIVAVIAVYGLVVSVLISGGSESSITEPLTGLRASMSKHNTDARQYHLASLTLYMVDLYNLQLACVSYH